MDNEEKVVDAAAEVDLLGGAPGRLAELVHELDHRVEGRATGVGADVREREGARLEQQLPEGSPPRR